MSHQASRAFQVLLVEDDPGDAGLIRNALKDERIGSFEQSGYCWSKTNQPKLY